ncbi:MAG: heavy metal-associated domain-containing protein, partial [Verrucomicrobia bacterium]|nr:heavy metal-associated domain-containing protein [Verrucomicrobiota bacterium]
QRLFEQGLVSILAVGFLAYPSIANLMLNASEDTEIAMGPNSSELVVSIPTMDCAACAVGIQGELKKIEGIDSAQITYGNKQAVIVYNSQIIEEQKILEAIKATGFPPEKLKVEQSHVQ